MRNPLTLIVPLVIFCAPVPCLAVNFYDGARAPKGTYFLTYTSFYTADKVTDRQGHTVGSDFGYRRFEELLRLCYYTPNAVFTAFVPSGRAASGAYDTKSQGLGDINLGAGHFLAFTRVDILPMLFVEFPTGANDSGKVVNYGSGQYDIKPVVFLYKQMGRFSVDAAAKYFFRLKNPKTDVTPGNETVLQCLLGWQVNDRCKFGPSLNWSRSARQRFDGNAINDSQKEIFSAGLDLYLRLPRVSVTLTYLRDYWSENTTEGDFFQVKTCMRF